MDNLPNDLSGTKQAASPIPSTWRSLGSLPSQIGRTSLLALLPEFIALGGYLALVATIILHHEPVADEAQAWQLVRGLPLAQLFHSYLRYEGSPGLWYLVLSILIRLHVSYAGLHWVCGVIACTGAALLIFRAPFPRFIRLLLPFTYFLAFQYAIVARSYVLFPPLILTLAAIWKKGAKRPWAVALLLGCIANISLHCAVISGGFAIAYAIELFRGRDELGKNLAKFLGPVTLILVLYGFVIWTAWPPGDLWVASQIPPTAAAQSGKAVPDSTGAPPALRTSVLRTSGRGMVLGALAASVLGIATPIVLGFPFWVVMIWHFRGRRQVYLMTPLALFVLFSAVSAFAFWHSGLLAISLIAVFWISAAGTMLDANHPPVFQRMVVVALLYVIGIQIAWTANAAHFDYLCAYSPDLAASRYLRPLVNSRERIAVTYSRETGISAYDAVGLLPYFDHNFYMNVAHPFWVWSTRNNTEAEFWRSFSKRPEVVLVEFNERTPYNPTLDTENAKLAMLTAAGYTHTQTFCGAKLAQFTVLEYTCHLVFERRPN